MKIDGLAALKRAAEELRRIPDASKRAAYRAANAVAGKVVTQSRRDIAAQINLPQSYIRDQTRVTHAAVNSPVAYVRMRIRAVRLARFDASQLTVPAKRAKGDLRRGIAAGRKAAGAAVKVSRSGGRKTLKGAFFLPLRAGNIGGGNGMGLFIREGSAGDSAARSTPGVKVGKYRWQGRIRHLYGPSPDQLFRRWTSENIPDIKAMVAEAYASQLRYELKGSRK